MQNKNQALLSLPVYLSLKIGRCENILSALPGLSTNVRLNEPVWTEFSELLAQIRPETRLG